MTIKTQLLTIADWDAMPFEDGYRYEIIEGELFVSCSPGLTHQRVARNLTSLIDRFLEENPIGELIPTPGLILSEHSGVIPDLVVFLNQQRDTIITGERLTGPPALVIEIVSPGSSNVKRDRVAKLQLYSQHGVQEYWIVDPGNRTVEQYVADGSALNVRETLHGEDTLSAATLPRFSCPLSQIFRRI